MTTFGKSACLWHAFLALEEQNKSGEVLQSQLKVLTHNIGACLGVMDGQRLFDEEFEHSEGAALDFAAYLSFVKRSIFARVNDTKNNTDIALPRVDEICWFICAPFYLNRRVSTIGGIRRPLNETNAFKFWRVFNALAEVDASSSPTPEDDDEVLIPVGMDWEEVLALAQRISRLVGGGPFDKKSWREQLEPSKSFSFVQLMELVETTCLKGIDDTMTTSVIGELYEENILGVLKKGYLNKKGPHVLSWNERWFILTPTVLSYYVNSDETDKKGEILITDSLTANDASDSIMNKIQKQNRFVVHTPTKDYELSAVDSRTRAEWISALRNAVKLQSDASKTTLTKSEIRQRRISRYARREKLSQNQKKQILEREEKEKALQQLEAEKQKRAELEAIWKEEELRRQREREEIEAELEKAKQACRDAMDKYVEKDSQFEMEKQRLAELEEFQRTLQALLENERLARKAESNARSMQEKALQEEMEKKRQLEEMQAAMEKLLMDEQQKREGLEEDRHRQEMLLLEEKRMLIELENERLLRNKEYEDALARLHEAEKEKEDMKKQLEKKKVFLSKFTGDEPIFAVASHRGVDPGVKVGLIPSPAIMQDVQLETNNTEARDETVIAAMTSPDCEVKLTDD